MKNNATVLVVTTSATTTSGWYVSDWKFSPVIERGYAGVQTSGGTVTIQVAVSVEDTPTYVYTVASITSASFDGDIHGCWPQFRFITTGASSTNIGVVY
jgi:hypothetical protein